MRPRLVVVAPNVADAVRCAGGWLFDLVLAGWEAVVLTGGTADPRPLRILGARAVDLDAGLAARHSGVRAIAADAGLCESDERVRRLVLHTLERGSAEVWLWGDQWPASLDSDAGMPRLHRLSVAARAFKAQAMVAAATDIDSNPATETFRGSSNPAPLRLVPAP